MEVGMSQVQAVANEKWILTVRELHLGHCKETFRAGAVIELDESNGRLIIDGRRFNDTRDLDVLKRQSDMHPENPWVIPYSPEARKEVLQAIAPAAVPMAQQKKSPLLPGQKLQVIRSDEDLNEEIDIRSTQISKVHAAEKQAVRDGVKAHGMEIIRGDETVEERLASLKGKTDMGSIAERARLKASGSVKMAVVRDDSLGAGFGSKSSVSMNAGQHLPSREEAEARKPDAAALAEARKRDVEIRRKNAIEAGEIDAELVGGGLPAEEAEANTSVPEGHSEAPVAKEAAPASDTSENEALRAENAALKERMDRLEKMMTASAGAAPKRGRKPATEAKE
jgi:hypothetical protein